MHNLKRNIIDSIIEVEAGYVNNPNDSGGATNFGITERVARAWGYEGDMRDLPHGTAFDIYAHEYWDSVRGDKLCDLSEAIAHEVVDTGINCGVMRASEFLQRVLNVMDKRGKLYQGLKVDGHIGPATISALASYLSVRSELIMLKALNCLQGARYIELTERNDKNEDFIYGWFNKRVELEGD